MSRTLQTFVRTLVEIDCGDCGITFGVPESWQEQRLSDGKTFWCPNGHGRVYRKTEADILREKLADEKRSVQWWRERADAASKDAEHQRSVANGYKGALAKANRRAANGVCPCCKRTFANLARHIDSKHPDFKDAANAGEKATQ